MTISDQLKSTYEYALAYIANGFSVICLKPASKQPAIPSWKPNTVSIATKEQLESWFKNTDNNIAIITGRISSIFAIDIDGQDTYNFFIQKINSLTDKQLIQSIKETMKIKTGSGNTNLIFRFDPEEFPIGDELANTILWKDSSSNQQNNHSEIRLKGEGSYVLAPPSIHPDSNNEYTLVNGINPIALSREQIDKLIEVFTNINKSYSKSRFQSKSHNNQKLADINEIDEETVSEVVSRVKPYYKGGIRNDFILYFSGWLRKLGVSFDNAENLIKELAIDDEERNNRIKTLKETYKKQDPDEVAGYSYLLELLSDPASGSQDTIAKLKEIPKILEAKHIIKKDIKDQKKGNNKAKKKEKRNCNLQIFTNGKRRII
jgi:Bifunctional DNA primase/polymerase, N-terminal